MSYWSHNVEAWEEIVHKALARHFLSAAGFDEPNPSELNAYAQADLVIWDATFEAVQGVFRELEDVIYEGDSTKPGWHVWHRLMDIARNEIKDGEQAYFERYVP